ncbi:RagB/SusD family nutrient uptake outer membrane protein [Chryseobacterium taklimakanense]|uniref:RagB/SusD family nutrient uptake outer membrane protein n=1 Tax=Chryseobacterium taklimakanense TaxID=536441 RepID=UPI0023F9DFE0|nr:RagB/SusD family nutrient uptake outer membrane protein [Chryseobacterium taklimakanense]
MKLFNKKSKTIFTAVLGLSLTFSTVSCVQDLEREPITDTTSANLFKDFKNYPLLLAKLYGAQAVGGQQGGDGMSDISGIDGGFSSYMRQLYTMQVITTDEAKIAWPDGTLPQMNTMSWTASNEFIAAIYYRLYGEIALCNEFIKNTSDEKLAANGITGEDLTEAKYMRGEARFLRALAYYNALDLFGNVPFVDENTGTALPKRIVRADLFNWLETETKALEAELKNPKSNEYGRADKAAAWMLLSRLYLNAKVYTGTEKNNDVITYTNKIIGAGYSLKSDYGSLFMADNHVNNPEVIFSINYDGLKTQTYGGTTFLIHAAVGGSMPVSYYGINGGWGGMRVTKSFVSLFPTDGSDKRGRFYTDGQTLEINDLSNFKNGYGFTKYRNIRFSDGKPGSDTTGNFVDADIPFFRLGDVYLMYAEATLRGGNGNMASALQYVNALRARAGATPVVSMNLDFILSERGREMSWEMTRRSDLIRFGKFTGSSYLWAWKGGAKDGAAVPEYRNLFPIPTNDIIANANLVQNPGY